MIGCDKRPSEGQRPTPEHPPQPYPWPCALRPQAMAQLAQPRAAMVSPTAPEGTGSKDGYHHWAQGPHSILPPSWKVPSAS